MEYEKLTDNGSIEVELAGAWERIGAYLLNWVFTFGVCAVAMMFWGFGLNRSVLDRLSNTEITDDESLAMVSDLFGTSFWIGMAIFMIYGIWQVYMMSKHGQSLGKRILNIRVIKSNGEDAGFLNVVLLREVVYQLLFMIVGALLALFGEMGDTLTNVVSLGVVIVSVVLLFAHGKRRTVHDFLADTVVIKLPR